MINNNSMVAEFDEKTLLKLIIDRENPGQFIIITLDEDGEEVDQSIEALFPMFKATLVNNSSYPVAQEYGTIEAYGMCTHKIIVQPGDTVIVEGLLGTSDGETYVYIISGYDTSTVQYAVSDTVGCMLYGGYIVITDIDPHNNRGCTITYTDL